MPSFKEIGEFSTGSPAEGDNRVIVQLPGLGHESQETGFVSFTQEEIDEICLKGVARTLKEGLFTQLSSEVFVPKYTERMGVLTRPHFVTTSAFVLPETKAEEAFAGVDLKVEYARTQRELLVVRKWRHLGVGHNWKFMERVTLPEIGTNPGATSEIIDSYRNKEYKYPADEVNDRFQYEGTISGILACDGEWVLVSDNDPRWNARGHCDVGGLMMPLGAQTHIDRLKEELGEDPPEDLRYIYMKD